MKFLKELSGFALLSFCLAVFSIYDFLSMSACCTRHKEWSTLLASFLAVLFGIISLHSIKRNNYKGRSFATWGIVLGILEIIVYVLLINSYYYPYIF